jgi:hypothetical protein
MSAIRKSILHAGFGLILATNLAALGGVAYNRIGEPDSVLRLTQRELHLPYRWGFERENGGLGLTLHWRLPVEEPRPGAGIGSYHAGGSAKWLDHAKLLTLGFDGRAPARPEDGTGAVRPLPREVLLVLEFDGPAYRRAREIGGEVAAREQALQAANPGNEDIKRRAKMAKDQALREENEASRLFVVDAGLDAARLRATYPDRSRYALVRGEVRARWVVDAHGRPALSGQLDGLLIDRIHVPHALHAGPDAAKSAPFEAAVNFGRRFEPWIAAATGL